MPCKADGRQSYVFLDRDGVINKGTPGYVSSLKEFKFLPGVKRAVRSLNESGFDIVVVSNQSCIGKGIVSHKTLSQITDHMVKEIRKAGAGIAGVYYCPCTDKDKCFCRKPKPGLLLEAAQDFDIDLSTSWMVGDEDRDIQAGKQVGSKTILIENRESTIKKQRRNSRVSPKAVKPDFTAKDLPQAVKIILRESKR